ncbi:5-formyltetrahydrofolate cyclo-ligase [Marinomonas transparens]|uniref:5-formyltetrahydrofolate cyclo-ligase n=1 Tax=Marinomonas transparens TaxID=2795388 RepID=A0A934MYW1_9GAMM|nr:5-formyltetrahydrofolate cyclo-ligase [Marinomonas transparens]MBJ7536890.1 5-formyltetrahydrofolate cyclo-ligase [Marinomonas transparens]
MTSLLDSRQRLRRQLRQARRHLSADEQQTAAQQIVERIIPYLSDIKHIALYLTNDGEISPHLLCEYLWLQGLHTYLPVVKDKHLVFASYTPDTIWQENRFGIKEPITTLYKEGNELDLVVLPLVGFDEQGGRLGMGGGFYDRTFADKNSAEAPLLIGLAHDCQQVKSLPIENWDVPLQAIITPSQTILV